MIDGRTNTLSKTIEVRNPSKVAVDPSNELVYVATDEDSSIKVIDGRTDTVTTTIETGGEAIAMAIDSESHTAYVLHESGHGQETVGAISIIAPRP